MTRIGGGDPVETRYEYDNVDNLTAIVGAYGLAEAQRTEFEHDPNGNRTVLRDALGNETAWAYDALNRPTSETIVLGSGGGTHEATRSWQYDKLSAVVAYIDRSLGDDHNPGDVTTWTDAIASDYEFDALGRLVYLGHSIMDYNFITHDFPLVWLLHDQLRSTRQVVESDGNVCLEPLGTGIIAGRN